MRIRKLGGGLAAATFVLLTMQVSAMPRMRVNRMQAARTSMEVMDRMAAMDLNQVRVKEMVRGN